MRISTVGASIVTFIVVLIIITSWPFTIVKTGQVGIVSTWGEVSRTLEPGLHLITPFADSVAKMDVQTQKEQAEASAASLDMQTVNTTIAVNYNIDPAKARDIYSKIGTGFADRVITPSVQEVVKAVTAKYNASDLLSKRQQVSSEILEGMKQRLNPYDISVTNVSIVNFSFSPAFEQAIEDKQVADQKAKTAKNNLDAAILDAQAIKVKSEAANNEKYIQLQALEVQKDAIAKWNGVLPAQMIPGSALPFINLTK